MATGKVFDRAVVIVLDSVGAGELPDAASFGDAGAHTLGSLVRKHGLSVPNMAALGLARFVPGMAPPAGGAWRGASARLAELSNGKDTLVGHWEMAGAVSERPFPTYPGGFPAELIAAFAKATGRGVIGNVPASGTEIIQELGPRHVRSGDLIVYTSADSVFQVAAHEEVVPLEELYAACEKARELVRDGPHRVARVIARPFVGDAARGFTRTPNRHDYAVPPPEGILLERMAKAGLGVVAVGKIRDIFDGVGIAASHATKSNADGIAKTIELARARGPEALLFVNLVDFDMLYGHRRDPVGYKASLEAFDAALPGIEGALGERDVLFITADHGNDPTFRGTDHTREYVPLLIAGKPVKPVDLGVRRSFADLGATIAENFGVEPLSGESFLAAIAA